MHTTSMLKIVIDFFCYSVAKQMSVLEGAPIDSPTGGKRRVKTLNNSVFMDRSHTKYRSKFYTSLEHA